ncbi:MAG: hypothetical protein EA421_11470 [Gemmatimonadales bacterium]|nr:MAG: hypothetical protein EA421_11470 [Gemmatimonadales bacterium]
MAGGLVSEALQEVEGLLPPGVVLEKGPEAPLAAPEGPLDSLGIVNLVAAAEEAAAHRGIGPLGLMEALSLPLEESPFRSVRTLEAWVEAALAGKA